MGTASGGVAACPCGPPGQPAGEQRPSQDRPEPQRGTPLQVRQADPQTTDTPLRHRLLLPVEGSEASTPGSDLPQNLIPGDPKLAAFLDVSVQIVEPAVELCALLRGYGDIYRSASEAIPQPLKKIQTLLRTEAIDLDRHVTHNPILSPVVLQGNDGEQWR